MEHDGTLPKSLYPRARWLVGAVHRELPGVRVQAFLGDVLATESPDGMRLEKPATRAAVVGSARQVLDVGYDGVHLDLEPLHSGDGDYLSLLDDVRAVTRARDAQLSVAAHQIDPLPGFHSFWGTVAGHPKWWSQEFFGQVARRVDQIAVMSYDTMQPLESLYGGYVAQQTSLALEVTPPTTHLLMGLPFYHENRFGHWNHAETVAAAVRGVRLGLSRTDATGRGSASPRTSTSRRRSRTGRRTGTAGCARGCPGTGGRSSRPARPAGRTCGRRPAPSTGSARCP